MLHFVENVASVRHFQPLLEEGDEVLLSDCAMFCRASPEPLVSASGTLYMQSSLILPLASIRALSFSSLWYFPHL